MCKPSHGCIPIPEMLPGTSKMQPSHWLLAGRERQLRGKEQGMARMAMAAPLPLWRRIVLRVLWLAHSQPPFLV